MLPLSLERCAGGQSGSSLSRYSLSAESPYADRRPDEPLVCLHLPAEYEAGTPRIGGSVEYAVLPHDYCGSRMVTPGGCHRNLMAHRGQRIARRLGDAVFEIYFTRLEFMEGERGIEMLGLKPGSLGRFLGRHPKVDYVQEGLE